MSGYRVSGIEWKNRRRDRRVTMPAIEIEMEGSAYSTVDWSLGGFLIDPYQGKSPPGATVAVTIVVIVGDRIYRHQAAIEIVRIDPRTAQLAGRYTQLAPDAVDTLEGMQTGRLRRAQNAAG